MVLVHFRNWYVVKNSYKIDEGHVESVLIAHAIDGVLGNFVGGSEKSRLIFCG